MPSRVGAMFASVGRRLRSSTRSSSSRSSPWSAPPPFCSSASPSSARRTACWPNAPTPRGTRSPTSSSPPRRRSPPEASGAGRIAESEHEDEITRRTMRATLESGDTLLFAVDAQGGLLANSRSIAIPGFPTRRQSARRWRETSIPAPHGAETSRSWLRRRRPRGWSDRRRHPGGAQPTASIRKRVAPGRLDVFHCSVWGGRH